MASNQFTWIETYREITTWLLSHKNNQKFLINTLKSIGIDGFRDFREGSTKSIEEFELDEIDPFSFFCYLNKYKLDSNRVDLLQKLYKLLNLKCVFPTDVLGLPTSNPLKVRLFPFKHLRASNDINNLWNFFEQAVKQNIDNALFESVLKIKGVGKGKLSISLFYVNPELYISLDSRSINYLHSLKFKQTNYNSISDYIEICKLVINLCNKLPYEISLDAWNSMDLKEIFIDEIKDIQIGGIGSVKTLLELLEKINNEYDEKVSVFYRGHSNYTFKLEPFIYREDYYIKNEDKLFKQIIARTPFDFRDCQTTFEKLVKMQHYSLPTRLLDITSNPLVALFFACKDETQKNMDGKLFRFTIKEDEIKYYDSDTVSVVANISRRPYLFSITSIKNLTKEDFNSEDEIQYLLHEIRSEKPHFSPVIESKHLEMTFCVRPKLDNPRIIRQEGAFFIFGIDNDKSRYSKFEFEYDSFIINKSDKVKILKQLDTLGINESTLFPEIEHVAMHLKEKYF